MKPHKKVIIFGAGLGGKRAFMYLSNKSQVLAFADNNPELHKKLLRNVPIIGTEEISNFDYDKIFIASADRISIKKQLIDSLGIANEKIEFLPSQVINGDADFFLGESRLFYLSFLLK